MRRDTSRGIRRQDIPNWRICLYGALYFLLLGPQLTIDPAKHYGYLYTRLVF